MFLLFKILGSYLIFMLIQIDREIRKIQTNMMAHKMINQKKDAFTVISKTNIQKPTKPRENQPMII